MKNINIFPVIILFILFSCNKNPEENSESANMQDEIQNENDSLVRITDSPKEEAGIRTGMIEEKELRDKVSCKGVIEVLPNYIVTVIPPVKGFIKEFYYETGDFVKKGAKLVRLSHPEFLRIQEEYLSKKSRTEYLETEYERQGELAVEKAASLKKMQKAKANYLESKARLQSLIQKLEMMNIDPDQIKEDKLISDVYIYSPINGRITETNSSVGELADQDNPVYEIMNMNHMRLRLNVPEKDIARLSSGQRVEYALHSDTDRNYTTQIGDIGNKVNEEERTFPVYADIQGQKQQFKHGSYVNAEIFISSESYHVVPNEAIIRIDGSAYVFLSREGGYRGIRLGSKGV